MDQQNFADPPAVEDSHTHIRHDQSTEKRRAAGMFAGGQEAVVLVEEVVECSREERIVAVLVFDAAADHTGCVRTVFGLEEAMLVAVHIDFEKTAFVLKAAM
jgi:hypothetical protein